MSTMIMMATIGSEMVMLYAAIFAAFDRISSNLALHFLQKPKGKVMALTS